MPKLKVLSGTDVIRIFQDFGFEVVSRKGSHVKLRRFTSENEKQTIVIPVHDELDKGTLRAIYNQSTRFISESELKKFFY